MTLVPIANVIRLARDGKSGDPVARCGTPANCLGRCSSGLHHGGPGVWTWGGHHIRRPAGERVEPLSLPIRLSPTATSGSVRPCSWTFTSVAIFGSHNRSQSSSDFFPTTRPAPPTWRRLAGATAVCPHCQAAGEPFRFANRPGVLRCRKCRRDTGLTVGTVMARSHTP